MNRFPLELVERISSFLDVDDLKRTLFVSRLFQAAAERYCGGFESFNFGRYEDDHEKFLSIYGTRRLSYLRYVEIHTQFPPLSFPKEDSQELPCRESVAELQEKDDLFTAQVKQAFQTIKKAEISAETRSQGLGNVHLVLVTPVRWVSEGFCWHRLYSAWRVHLLCPEELPELASVRELTVCNPSSLRLRNKIKEFGDWCSFSRLDLRVVVDLASKCPNLECLFSSLGKEETLLEREEQELCNKHFEHDYEACARDSRFRFSDALNKVKFPSTLRRVQMDFLYDHNFARLEEHGGGPNLVEPAPCDLFSASFHTFSPSLRRLSLRAKVDQTLFTSLGDMVFPNMEILNVFFHPTTPSGSWYFKGCNGEGERDVGYTVTDNMRPPFEENPTDARWHFDQQHQTYETERFRVAPNEDKLYPLLESFAKATTKMHALKRGALWSYTDYFAWGVQYFGTHEYHEYQGEQLDLWRNEERWICWIVGQWRPPLALQELFEGIGRDKYGEQLRVCWNAFPSIDPRPPLYKKNFKTEFRGLDRDGFLDEGYIPHKQLPADIQHPRLPEADYMTICERQQALKRHIPSEECAKKCWMDKPPRKVDSGETCFPNLGYRIGRRTYSERSWMPIPGDIL
ncbi:hypothetical protein BU24DRAFT_419236 [Aaosphaeria arxii CBS 175.79]|uniref:F-box domain-containing protein n=1 Tax=Aaosphaeria arxii CBS 175.79 TaxID=1450172 RepID=A0A6A5Y518_9PLEO|nr:uncharacterized protein BU24DRAFT_419236 [Aaosphaeria arxii CBS 175.79]KAF2019624.1 hypothetical protein BU24DRAFT_419236 [Aaosphaeria arxii CBS 175.79]